VLGAIACGAIYIVLGPVFTMQPTIPAKTSEPTRALAYEQKIARTNQSAPAPEAAEPEQQAAVPADAAPTEPAAQDMQATAPGEGAGPPASQDDMAALPPDQGAPANGPDSLPWQHAGRPDYQAAPGPGAAQRDQYDDPAGAQQPGQDQGRYDEPYGSQAALPGENDDPNAWPQGPQDEPQEWVQVLVSGAGMHSTASEDSPALFAFPYGRTLRVVSRYEGWVEVTDPQSAATGWMKAQYLAPARPPGMRQEQNAEQMYDDEDMPRWKRRWLRRHGGGLGDLIGRALEGDF